MANQTINLTPNLYEYMLKVGVREHPVMAELRELTATMTMAQMQISPDEAQFLAMLVRLMNAKGIIELGTFTGYSALGMALALPEDGNIICCDVSKEWTDIARKYWGKAGVIDKIDLRIGPALETLDNLIHEKKVDHFDLIFIDADKANYPHYYERALELIRKGGIVLIDNVFRGGDVADLDDTNKGTSAIRELNNFIHGDERVEVCIVPIGDGVTIVRKR